MRGSRVEFIREGKYMGEAPVELVEEVGGWSPYLSLEDARKLDAVRMRCGTAMSPPPRGMGGCSS
jgi:hypothetical protein